MSIDPDEVIDLICSRRSVRLGYDERPIPRAVLEQVVRCGLSAPCSKGAPPWRLTIVTDRQRLLGLARSVTSAPAAEVYVPHDPKTGRPRPGWESTVAESAAVLAAATAAVFIENTGPFSGGRRALLDADPLAREWAMTGFELELVGLGAALENMWLCALAGGLSAAFMGDVGVAEADIRRELGLEGDLLGVLVIGHAERKVDSDRRVPDPSALVRWDPPREAD